MSGKRFGLAVGLLMVFGTSAFAFPWKKSEPPPYIPPFFGYYPTQWREFPPCDTPRGNTVVTPATPVNPMSETLPEPKRSFTTTSAVRGAAPLPPLDPVQQTEVEKFRPPLATLGEPVKIVPLATLGSEVNSPLKNRAWRASAPEKD